jgi:hypothetical protein
MKKQSIDEHIQTTEKWLNELKFVKSHFPNAQLTGGYDYISKSVNAVYEKWDFHESYSGLYVIPYVELQLTTDDKVQFIKVFSQPKRNVLVHRTWACRNGAGVQILKFARMNINVKTHSFKDEMINSCRAEIMKYVQKNPKHELDTKHLEPRLKKLLAFT